MRTKHFSEHFYSSIKGVGTTVLGGLWATAVFCVGFRVGVINLFGSIDKHWRDQQISVKFFI